MIKMDENTWETDSDIYGWRVVKTSEGLYEVYSFDECYDEFHFEEIDSNLSYLERKYGFNILQEDN